MQIECSITKKNISGSTPLATVEKQAEESITVTEASSNELINNQEITVFL
jgi:hypothetical protein